MICQTVTIATRLEQTEEVRNYFKNYITEYNRVYRELWHSMIRPEYRTRYPKESFFVTEMCQKHQMLKRTINSIRMDIKGKILALKALKETELNQLQLKILQKEKKIQSSNKLIKRINLINLIWVRESPSFLPICISDFIT